MRGLIAKLFRYAFTGGLAAIVDAGGFGLLVMAKFAVAPAAVTSFCVAAVVNYRLTSRLVFRQDATGRGFALFLLAALVGLLVNVSVTLATIAALGLPPLAAKIVGIGTAFLLNFALNVGVVFRNGANDRRRCDRDGVKLGVAAGDVSAV